MADLHRDRLHRVASTGRDLLAHSGCGRWELFAKVSLTREIAVTPGASPQVTQVEELGSAVRIVRGGRAGFGAASGIEADTARRAVDAALAAEAPAPFDPLPPPRLLGVTELPPARPPVAQGWALHTVDELATALARLSGGTLALRRALVQEGTFGWLLTTAEGFVAVHEGASSSLLAEVQPTDRRSGVWRDWFHIPEPERFEPAAAARRIADRALLTRSHSSADTGLHDLILDPEVSAQLLAAVSPLLVAAPGEDDPLPGLLTHHGRLAAPALTLLDDRTDPLAPITGPCDGEGLPSRRTLLLEEGVPRHRVASFADAVAVADAPRGGALRLSYRDYPRSGIANLRVAVDHGLAPSALLAATDRALYLLRPLAPMALDAAADSYRIVASGVWLRGQRVHGWHPVVEIAGSLSRLLRRIEAVGTDLAWFQSGRGCVGAPSLLVRSQPVVG